jgi:hypothetical protein
MGLMSVSLSLCFSVRNAAFCIWNFTHTPESLFELE